MVQANILAIWAGRDWKKAVCVALELVEEYYPLSSVFASNKSETVDCQFTQAFPRYKAGTHCGSDCSKRTKRSRMKPKPSNKTMPEPKAHSSASPVLRISKVGQSLHAASRAEHGLEKHV